MGDNVRKHVKSMCNKGLFKISSFVVFRLDLVRNLLAVKDFRFTAFSKSLTTPKVFQGNPLIIEYSYIEKPAFVMKMVLYVVSNAY